ncbi:S-layer homology domain-containing protein [Paenibacillus sp. J5C2022]|uniref:S-layer homology domain-containing protein n=1 Tax=Paenibacillus sp. J5C2022 TaxID=2977129 RepID=UPI0021CF2AD0|nr:S-layer homology domain-containing protein [Paenibacillus sp. J5C2022]
MNGGGATAGWSPENASPKFYNNIFAGCTGNAIVESHAPINPQHDYNLYHNCASAPVEGNGVYDDPLFVNSYEDWHLSENSPAWGKGTALDVVGFYDEKINVDVDYDGVSRDDVWDLGIYKYVSVDLNPPIWPVDSGLTLSNMTHNSLQLTWPDATDNVHVAGYRLYVNDDEVANVDSSVNERNIDNLEANTSYKLELIAYDAAGNEGSPLIVIATTSASSNGSSGHYSGVAYLSSNAYLNSLVVQINGEAVSLDPIFTEEQTNYNVQTNANQTEVLLSPSHFAAKVTLQGEVIDKSIVVDLEEGDNLLEFIVQAENGTSKTYTLTIHRELSELESPTPEISLIDINGHWAESSIMNAILEGIASGYPDNTFKPNSPITRAEFTVMLMNTLAKQSEMTEKLVLPVEATLSMFTDQAQIGEWAEDAIANAVQKGIIQGYNGGQFRPNAQITRAELSVMLARSLDLQLSSYAETAFQDHADIPNWAKAAVEAMHELGIVNGREQNRFVNETATRAEATTMLLRLLNHSRSVDG